MSSINSYTGKKVESVAPTIKPIKYELKSYNTPETKTTGEYNNSITTSKEITLDLSQFLEESTPQVQSQPTSDVHQATSGNVKSIIEKLDI